MAPAQLNDSARAMMAVIKGDFAKSHAANGYQKFPDGLIFQWGVLGLFADTAITFPIAFPNACRGVVATMAANPTSARLISVTIGAAPTLTGSSLFPRYVDNGGVVGLLSGFQGYWMAVGY
jgi:hypothetical protein